ncbi:hypothetical protein R1flu_018737 [Riccia fluitans]|uniref:Double-strand-break repair protein rad21 n=1 Tax=Riccia fluitans TaxID=41844 RepID=A0ABD1ZGQ0_9MARC
MPESQSDTKVEILPRDDCGGAVVSLSSVQQGVVDGTISSASLRAYLSLHLREMRYVQSRHVTCRTCLWNKQLDSESLALRRRKRGVTSGVICHPFILAKKGPLGTIWIAAHLERKLRKNQVTETNISASVDSILFPEVPIALRLSGHLLLGVVRIYSRKVNYLFHDCSEALVKIKQAFHAGAVDLPPEAATAPFHSITLPETFDLDEFEPLPDREMNLLHSNGGSDHHVTTREQITLQDPTEDSSYLDSQFGLDERFPEGDAPSTGIDFDEDLLDKPSRQASPDVEPLPEDHVPPTVMDHGIDYGQMDRMEAMDIDDDRHEPGTPALGMDLDYQPEFEDEHMNGEFGATDEREPDLHAEQIELDHFEPDLSKPDQLEPATPGTLELEQDEGEGGTAKDDEGEGGIAEQDEGEGGVAKQDEGEGELVDRPEKDIMEADDNELERGEKESSPSPPEDDFPAENNQEEDKHDEEEGKAGIEDAEGAVQEREEVDRREVDNTEDEGSKEDVPEYETVMTAVDVPNQEPDVFDIEQDMRKEMPSVMFRDQDEYMEERGTVLVEDREVGMDLEELRLPGQEGPSPATSPPMPEFNPDGLPGDDEVLASLLGGRSTPVLNLAPTPKKGAAVVMPRQKRGQRKRKIVMDMNTILPADVMREQLMNTDDIRRVRRKAPCSRQELWIVQKDTLGQQIFCEQSIPGLCSALHVLFQRVYVAGAAVLPLADNVEAEPTPGAVSPRPEEEIAPVNDVREEVREEHEASRFQFEPVAEDGKTQGAPSDVPSNADMELEQQEASVGGIPQQEVSVGEDPQQEASIGEINRQEIGVMNVDDGQDARIESRFMEQYEAGEVPQTAEEAAQTVVIEEKEVSDAGHVPAVVKDDETHLSPERTHEATQAAQEAENINLEDIHLAAEQEVTPATEEIDVNVVVSHAPEITIPAPEVIVPEPEPEAEPEAEPEPVLEAESIHAVENISEGMAGATLNLVSEPLAEAEPEMMPSDVLEYDRVEEQNVCVEGPDVHKTDEAKISLSPIQVEEAEPTEQEPAVEELGFLGDAGDPMFLAADDDDLFEETEDFQDGIDYGENKKSAQDNSGWSARTRAVGHYLRSTLESKHEYMRKRKEEGTPKLELEQILVGKSRKEAARMFFETLVLKTKDYIHVEQESPFGGIHISARPKLLKANF